MERKGLFHTVKSVLGSKTSLFVSGVAVAGLVMTFGTGSGSRSGGEPHRGPAKLADTHSGHHAQDAKHGRKPAVQEHGEDETEVVAAGEESGEERGSGHEVAESTGHGGVEHGAHAAPVKKVSAFRQLADAYKNLFQRIQAKIDEIMRLDIENHRLALENANLRRWGQALRFGCQADNSFKSTRRLGTRLSSETWAKMGRSLASIRYELPANLLPKQLYSLGVNFFRGHEDEKAAKILAYLTGMEDDDTYKNARDFLLTGIAWYRIDHLKEAERYFELAIKTDAKGGELRYHAQARLWKAVVAQRRNDRRSVQASLNDFMDHHPRSPEAEWVNDSGPRRSVASDREVQILETDTPVEKEHEGPSHRKH